MPEKSLKNRRSFPPEFKLKLCAQMACGQHTVAQLSREHSIKDTVLYRWRDEFLEHGAEIFTRSQTQSERIAELEREIGRQHMEIEILKKASKILL